VNASNHTDQTGLACLSMVAAHFHKELEPGYLQQLTGVQGEISFTGLSQAAEKLGFRSKIVQLTTRQLLREVLLPCILQWDGDRYAVLMPGGRWSLFSKTVRCAHPGEDVRTYSRQEFMQHWLADKQIKGKALLLEPTFRFHALKSDKKPGLSWRLMIQYFRQSRWQIAKVIASLLITSLLQLIFPFLMQSIVDVGITTLNLDYITLVLIAQLMLVFSQATVDFIRSHLLLHISTVVNLSILSDFWIKLTRLPIAFFDRQHTGDIMQRINDNKEVQNFFTGPALNTMFSLINFLVFGIVLIMYKVKLFVVFGIAVILYFLWMRLFLPIRRKINYQVFDVSSQENNSTVQMVQGMQEIRLQNVEQAKRWEWENVQVDIFRLHFKSLTYGQLQTAGAIILNHGKDAILTFMVAKLVIQGELTFGAMLAIQYIIGQLTGPVEQFNGFVQDIQDARISMERLNQIHAIDDEEDIDKKYILQLPPERSIHIKDLRFTYPNTGKEPVLNNISLEIPAGKTTAIVGESGSGKTTLLKILLKFYSQYDGEVQIGGHNFNDLGPSFWRKQCGAVLQDGYIFNDTIAKNIAVQYEEPDTARLMEACRIANILSFIEASPLGFETRLGAEGMGISQGEKQRILIARAVYRNPSYLFFDESTNALDANSEKVIVENLKDFYKNKTVIIVAHRLSTVRNADKIIVMHKGSIIEQGNHQSLAERKGKYFSLVKNQLELGQ
jgi:ATP-binding cassette, subfamily B, bacterial